MAVATADRVTNCSWCDRPSVPDPAAHPDGQAEHVYAGARPAMTREIPPDLVLTVYAASTVVESAPEEARISLGVLAASDPRGLYVNGDKIFVGDDRAGNEVVYRVVGWDAEQVALIVRRVYRVAGTSTAGGRGE